MADGESGRTPFGTSANTLIPLEVAFSRADIRRRREVFELPSYITPSHSPTDVVPTSPQKSSVVPSASYILAECGESSLPCFPPKTRSADDRPKKSVPERQDHAEVDDESCGCSPPGLVQPNMENGGRAEGVERSFSSFDEDSFIRIAERSLGW